jgi:hypothetical protein
LAVEGGAFLVPIHGDGLPGRVFADMSDSGPDDRPWDAVRRRMQPRSLRHTPKPWRRSGKGDAGFPGSEILHQPSVKEVLRKILEGDPLGIAERCSWRLKERAVLLDASRLTLRAMARTAYRSSSYHGDPPLADWLTQRIDESIRDLVIENRESEQAEIPIGDDPERRFAFLTETIGVSASIARRVCVVFNDLSDDRRNAFWAMVIEGQSLNRYVAEGHGPPAKAKEDLKQAFLALSLLSGTQGELPDEEGQR